MNWRERIRKDADRCAVATTFNQIESILTDLIEDVMLDDATLARNRGLYNLALLLARRAEKVTL